MKRDISAIDSTTLKLSLFCIDWARRRRRKAAAKTHMRLNVGTMLPSFAIVEDASHHDPKRAGALCGGLRDGDVPLAGRACLDLAFPNGLQRRGVSFVLREKENMVFDVVERRRHEDPSIISDETMRMSRVNSGEKHPGLPRRVTAVVEVDGRETIMSFITDNFVWSPRTIAERCKARWAIELFFKELKQTLQLNGFVGCNVNAVKWQVWTGLLAHLLIRFQKHISKWSRAFPGWREP